MSWQRSWVVLVPGDVAWVEKRTREILEKYNDGSEHHFRVIPGQGRYQAIVKSGKQEVETEFLLGELLSHECEDPVYTLDNDPEFPYISRFSKGAESLEDQGPEELMRSLGCEPPWSEEPPPPLELPKKTRQTVALIQGLSKAEVINGIEDDVGVSLPEGFYRLEETPQGLLLTDGTGELAFADVGLSERFPRSTIYSVSASPDLDFFSVLVKQNHKTEHFSRPPKEFPVFPVIEEVMGEREPERILAALGIPKEWFII